MSIRKRTPVINILDLPVILILADMAALFRCSERTIRRQLEAGTFRPLPRDKYPYRWYRDDVIRYLATAPSQKLPRRPHGAGRQTRQVELATK